MEAKLATRSLYYNPDVDTLDIWIGDPSSETHGDPMTENLISKLDAKDNVIGYEIIQLSNLDAEDMEAMPKEVRALLRESANRLSLAIKLRS